MVSNFFRQNRSLGPRERQALADTVYAVLRRRPVLGHLAQGGSGALTRRLAMLAWQGERASLMRAVTDDEAAWLERALGIDPGEVPEQLRHNLPPWLAQALQAQLGMPEFFTLSAALERPAALDLRVNALKTDRDAARRSLAQEGMDAQPTPWSPWGLRICGRPALQRAAVFLQGEVEVQDEGSQLLALLTGATRGEMVVDLCAGAGGKTLALGTMMRSTGRLYAFDTSAHRLAALQPRLARSGLSNVHPGVIAHERDERLQRLQGKIDRVLVDAPCSGLGTLRRNPDLKWRQTPQSVEQLAVRQAGLLRAALRLLRPGGRLVYATCSLLTQENEEVARAFEAEQRAGLEPVSVAGALGKAGVRLEAAEAESAGEPHFLRLWPHRHGTDGFFAAVWQRL